MGSYKITRKANFGTEKITRTTYFYMVDSIKQPILGEIQEIPP